MKDKKTIIIICFISLFMVSSVYSIKNKQVIDELRIEVAELEDSLAEAGKMLEDFYLFNTDLNNEIKDDENEIEENWNEIEIIRELSESSFLIDEFSDLGGTSFFLTHTAVIFGEDILRIDFEDGHIAGTAYIKYEKNEDSTYSFKLIGADI